MFWFTPKPPFVLPPYAPPPEPVAQVKAAVAFAALAQQAVRCPSTQAVHRDIKARELATRKQLEAEVAANRLARTA